MGLELCWAECDIAVKDVLAGRGKGGLSRDVSGVEVGAGVEAVVVMADGSAAPGAWPLVDAAGSGDAVAAAVLTGVKKKEVRAGGGVAVAA